MNKMLVSSFSINGVCTVEIKHNDHYTIIAGVTKHPGMLLIKAALIALWEEHICALGWQDHFGFHYGKQPINNHLIN